jgi:hypothetical protein
VLPFKYSTPVLIHHCHSKQFIIHHFYQFVHCTFYKTNIHLTPHQKESINLVLLIICSGTFTNSLNPKINIFPTICQNTVSVSCQTLWMSLLLVRTAMLIKMQYRLKIYSILSTAYSMLWQICTMHKFVVQFWNNQIKRNDKYLTHDAYC